MSNASGTAEYTVGYRATDTASAEDQRQTLRLRLKAIPWTRVAVDVMLLAAMAVVSSKLFIP